MKIATVILGMLLALTACGRSPASEAARAEARLEELEEEFNELVAGGEPAFEELGKLLDEAAELDEVVAAAPASRELLRDARRELEELTVLWDEATGLAETADAAIAAEGWPDGPQLEHVNWRREQALGGKEDLLNEGTEQSVTLVREEIEWQMRRGQREIERLQEITSRKERAGDLLAEARREFAKMEQLFTELNVLDLQIEAAHTDYWEKRWAGENARAAAERRESTLAGFRRSVDESGWPDQLERVIAQIVSAQDDATWMIEEAEQQLEALKAGNQRLPGRATRDGSFRQQAVRSLPGGRAAPDWDAARNLRLEAQVAQNRPVTRATGVPSG